MIFSPSARWGRWAEERGPEGAFHAGSLLPQLAGGDVEVRDREGSLMLVDHPRLPGLHL
jgi:hypothetical protein